MSFGPQRPATSGHEKSAPARFASWAGALPRLRGECPERTPQRTQRLQQEEDEMQVYLSATEAAVRQGLTREGFYHRLRRYPLPPDAMIGKTKGWLPETIDAHAATIPPPGPPAHETRTPNPETP